VTRNLFIILTLSTIAVFLVNCSDDTTGPDSGTDTGTTEAVRFSGITITDREGNILGGDSTDWCYTVAKSGLAALNMSIPFGYALYPAYANPSAGPVRIDYDLPQQSTVHLYIIDTSETIIRNLVNQVQGPGSYSVIWDQWDDFGQFVDSGIYGCQIEAGTFDCFGDIQVDSTPHHVILYSSTSGGVLTVNYKASTRLGAILLIFDSIAVAGMPTLGNGANNMDFVEGIANGQYRVFVYTLEDYYILNGEHTLLTLPVTAPMAIDSVDPSDYWGNIMSYVVLNIAP
jgi:hypothetical protein